MKPLVETEHKADDLIIYLSLFKLHKSYLLLMSNQKEMGIGSVTLASPPTIEGVKSTAVSYNLFGVGTNLLHKIIAESASFLLKAPVLVLLFLKIKKKEIELAKPLISFLNNSLEGVLDSKKD